MVCGLNPGHQQGLTNDKTDFRILKMEIINFADTPSVVSQYMRELRDVNIQHDRMRFRTNIDRIGELMAYEISKKIAYRKIKIQTPLSECECIEPSEKIVIATLLRAGLPFHHGFLQIFDTAENAFVSAYRKYHEQGDTFDVLVEYMASPNMEGKTLLLVDPMLATGTSMELGYRALLRKGTPARIHIACVIASQKAVDYVSRVFPEDKTTLWCAAIDPEVNTHSYIVPGLGDAGDLAYGEKEDNA